MKAQEPIEIKVGDLWTWKLGSSVQIYVINVTSEYISTFELQHIDKDRHQCFIRNYSHEHFRDYHDFKQRSSNY